jgi:bacteriophage CI repressor helix-turn-helix domain
VKVKRLRETRENLDLKQIDLTDLFDVTYSTISGWETGKDTIPLKQLIKYANKYNYSLDYLLGLTDKNIEYKDLKINLNTLATNLRKKRKQYGKTQQQIADIINTSQSSYAHYENARYLMPLNFLYNLSKIYNDLSVDEMLGRKKK